MPTPKKLPKPRTRYYVDEPVIIVPLAEYERLVNHLVKVRVLENQPDSVRNGLKARGTLLLKECWETIRKAKQHYKIPTD